MGNPPASPFKKGGDKMKTLKRGEEEKTLEKG